MPGDFTLLQGTGALESLGSEWDMLAGSAGTPFVLRAWLTPFQAAFPAEYVVAALRDGDGLAAAALLRKSNGALEAAANDHTGDWDAVARNDAARAALWRSLAGQTLRLRGMREPNAGAARAALGGARVFFEPDVHSPYLRLPGGFQELLTARSANTRSQWRRRRRNLERAGTLSLRCVTGGEDLTFAFDALLAVEASGWKGRHGTAIATSPGTESLYRAFAERLAAERRLRLYLLELDGHVLAADLGCVVGEEGFLIKTGFDAEASFLSPGFVLRGEVLRASIDEGLRGYDFLGGPDRYKLRWTDELRPRVRLDALHGPAATWRRVRPLLLSVRRMLRR